MIFKANPQLLDFSTSFYANMSDYFRNKNLDYSLSLSPAGLSAKKLTINYSNESKPKDVVDLMRFIKDFDDARIKELKINRKSKTISCFLSSKDPDFEVNSRKYIPEF